MPSLTSLRPAIIVRIVVIALLLVVVTCLVLLYLRNHVTTAQRQPSGEAPPNSAPAQAKSGTTSAVGPSAGGFFDYRAALDRARALPNPRERAMEFGRYFQRWMTGDVGAALAYLQALPRTAPEFTQGLTIAVTALAASDPEYALRIANQLVTTREQQAVYNVLFADWAQRNPTIASQRIDQVPLARRDHAIRALAETWSEKDFGSAWRWAETLPVDQRAVAVEGALSSLISSDPKQAIQLAQTSLSGAALDRTVAGAIERLVATDLATAAATVGSLSPGEVQNAAAAEVARSLASQSPAEALRWSETLPDEAKAVASRTALQVWAATDARAAERYVLGMTPEAQASAALTVAEVVGESDPRVAVVWAETLAAPDARAGALARVADSWARHDPASAAQWVATNTDALANLAPSTLNATLSYWVLRDPVATQNFIGTLAAPAQASAAAFVAPLLAQQNPLNVMTWAQSLPNPVAREAALAAGYQRWSENSPVAARAWLSEAALPPDIKDRLQNAPAGK